jgi:hypothetical protein
MIELIYNIVSMDMAMLAIIASLVRIDAFLRESREVAIRWERRFGKH